MIELIIRETTSEDLKDILYVEHEAFLREKEPQITKDMLSDPSAQPYLSLLAYIDKQPVGHILFTHGYLANNPKVEVSFLSSSGCGAQVSKTRNRRCTNQKRDQLTS